MGTPKSGRDVSAANDGGRSFPRQPRKCSCSHSELYHSREISRPHRKADGTWATVRHAVFDGECHHADCGCQGFAVPLPCPASVWNALHAHDRRMTCWRVAHGGCKDCEP